MPSVSDSIRIDRPPTDVFAALADPRVQITYDGEMMKSVEQLSPGAIGKGTRFRGNFKGMGNVEYEYADFEQDRLIEHGVRTPFGSARHRFEFTPEGSGTRLTQSITVKPNLVGQILWPVLMKRMMSKRAQTLDRLVKAYVER